MNKRGPKWRNPAIRAALDRLRQQGRRLHERPRAIYFTPESTTVDQILDIRDSVPELRFISFRRIVRVDS